MAGITVWGRKTSANVQKVLWALEEVGQDFERIEAGGTFGGLDTAEYRAMNPNQLVPTIRDGDLVLWESSAMVRYVAATYGAGSLWPDDPKDRALSDQWADWANTTFQPLWLGVFALIVRTPPAQLDPEKVKAAVAAAVPKFEMLDARLANTPYVGGETFTYADILTGISLYRWTTLEIDPPHFAHVEAWHDRLKQRSGFANWACQSYDEMRVKD